MLFSRAPELANKALTDLDRMLDLWGLHPCIYPLELWGGCKGNTETASLAFVCCTDLIVCKTLLQREATQSRAAALCDADP